MGSTSLGVTSDRRHRTVVLGLGNPVVSDDRAGLAVAAALTTLLEETPIDGVDVVTSTRGGFELIDLLHGFATAILVDCCTPVDPEPGRVRQIDLTHIAGVARLVNAHEISVGDAFLLAESLGIAMPAEVEIFTVDAGDTTTIGETMTPEVAAAVEPLARRLHARLRAAGCGAVSAL